MLPSLGDHFSHIVFQFDERLLGPRVSVIGAHCPEDAVGLTEYLGDRALPASGTGIIDHIAFLATDLKGFWATLRREGYQWRDRTVPSLGLHQVFVEDPSGVTIEMNFPASEAVSIEHLPEYCGTHKSEEMNP